ncbi:hypothetical protein PHYPSEUDO_000746 [Phytophthora pseudosyringae]|uniref:Uncharacterized protein n=1 Tax=Phytophthora pseudosyringae TaxID=221518 RepID=A0A8T1WII4_9STRA|nr:hypothetical protein PHYPSEUDO_000746 [Phytophthora pseudosyringae]
MLHPRVEPSETSHSRQCAEASSAFRLVVQPLRVWKRLQVSYYGGKYSIERVLALDTYTRSTSVSRVLLVCIWTPMPMITLVVVQELIPLQDPSEGWRVNYGFWIRAVILAFVVGHTITGQARFLIDGVVISPGRLALLSACAAAMFTGGAAAISAYVVFPVPFFVLTLAPMFYVLLILAVRFIVGLDEMMAHSDQLIRYIIFVCAQVTVAIVYPLYESLFRVAQGTRYQMIVILLLPVIKVALKNMLLRCTANMEDMIPETVIFTVDFFNTIYIATCMQSASSAGAVAAITITDLLQTGVMLYGLHRRTAAIQAKLHEVASIPTGAHCVLTMLSSLCRDSGKFETQARRGIRIYSCLPHCISEADKAHLACLDKLLEDDNQVATPGKSAAGPGAKRTERCAYGDSTCKLRMLCTRKHRGSILPVLPDSASDRLSASTKRQNAPTKRSPILLETLGALFTTECIVVAAYLEAIVPLFYCNYILLMVHLPSAHYHTEMAGVTHENVGSTVRPVLLFGLLQMVSFALLLLVIKRNLGLRILYQIGFVLETQMSLIQGKLMLWMIITFSFRVVHFGMDFTYKFSWIG